MLTSASGMFAPAASASSSPRVSARDDSPTRLMSRKRPRGAVRHPITCTSTWTYLRRATLPRRCCWRCPTWPRLERREGMILEDLVAPESFLVSFASTMTFMIDQSSRDPRSRRVITSWSPAGPSCGVTGKNAPNYSEALRCGISFLVRSLARRSSPFLWRRSRWRDCGHTCLLTPPSMTASPSKPCARCLIWVRTRSTASCRR
mmetsp:Transcript_30706/g.91943  ORF Transcript_30706/g.91943 Transcript_30706/m.91943 type:complete len:204 (+) Transcript_30706:2419-3030(+)